MAVRPLRAPFVAPNGLRAVWLLAAALVLLSACAGRGVWAPDDAVQAARYAHPGAPELMLLTIMNNRTGRGDHTALVISGSERVLFDPAGSWYHRLAPERHDVHHGLGRQMYGIYARYHTRETHHTVVQRLPVSPQVAERALRLAQEKGPVANAFCARATAEILRELPGLEGISVTWFPHDLMAQFAALDGVQTHTLRHDDPGLEARIAESQRPL